MQSIVENTFQQWAAADLQRLFPDATFWWPATGGDLWAGLDSATTLPRGTKAGKLIVLEFKTPSWTAGRRHRLEIRREQLAKYLTPPPGIPALPVFYVFPLPFWNGTVLPWTRPPLARGRSTYRPADWRSTTSGDEWFTQWTWVLPAETVERSLLRTSGPLTARPQLFATPARPLRQVRTPTWNTVLRRLPGADHPERWDSFWAATIECGPAGATRWTVSSTGRIRAVPPGGGRAVEVPLGQLQNIAGEAMARRARQVPGQQAFDESARRDPGPDGSTDLTRQEPGMRVLAHVPSAYLRGGIPGIPLKRGELRRTGRPLELADA